jgi:hypothetical protein
MLYLLTLFPKLLSLFCIEVPGGMGDTRLLHHIRHLHFLEPETLTVGLLATRRKGVQEEIRCISALPIPSTVFIFHHNPYQIHPSLTYLRMTTNLAMQQISS